MGSPHPPGRRALINTTSATWSRTCGGARTSSTWPRHMACTRPPAARAPDIRLNDTDILHWLLPLMFSSDTLAAPPMHSATNSPQDAAVANRTKCKTLNLRHPNCW
eukprot:836279-Pyramimonas_sp.AAC.1